MGDYASYHWPQDDTERQIRVGDVVEFVDSLAIGHNALVTAVWPPGDSSPPSLNLVYISADPKAEDPYGRQLAERPTSVVHLLRQAAHGMFWRERRLAP